jgi:hypothetical protein
MPSGKWLTNGSLEFHGYGVRRRVGVLMIQMSIPFDIVHLVTNDFIVLQYLFIQSELSQSVSQKGSDDPGMTLGRFSFS